MVSHRWRVKLSEYRHPGEDFVFLSSISLPNEKHRTSSLANGPLTGLRFRTRRFFGVELIKCNNTKKSVKVMFWALRFW